jgi:predicted transcriptional regulator
MTQHETIAQILKANPHYSAPRIAALMGITDAHVRTLCARHSLPLLSRAQLEEHIDKKRNPRGKKV